jgi:hypothetical protein
MTCGILPGPYRVPAYRAVCHFRLTNKTPAATYRAPARYETTFVRERLMDAVAHTLKLDRIEVRRRNTITAAEMPYVRPLEVLGEEVHYDTGDYLKLLDRLLAFAGWEKLTAEAARRRAAGEAVGVGLSMFVEKSGLGPADGVQVAVDSSGTVEVVTGGASLGQGFETVMAQVCAGALGVDYRRVRVVHGQTDRIAFGIGAHASRATVMTASATHIAARKLRAKAIEVAAELMQMPVEALDIVDGEVKPKNGAAGPSISLAAIAASLAPTSKTLNGRTPGLCAEGWFFTKHQTYPYGCHIAVVRVDRDTGDVAVERYVIGYDIGRAINPMLVKGQIVGGFAQGLGGALFEEFLYSERGDPLSTTLADYLMPTVCETPQVEVLLTEDAPTLLNPLGIKGAGESGITGVGAAIASAIDDAIGIPGAVTRLPITPQRLKQILDAVRFLSREGELPERNMRRSTGRNLIMPDTAIDTRAAARSNLPRQDLRSWLAAMEAAGEVRVVRGAEREREIGGIVDIYQRRMGNPAVLFDDIPGYPRGHRVLANILTSVRRINLTLGLGDYATEMDLVRYWRRYMKEAKTIPPVTVSTGAVCENVREGNDIDIFTIPTPRWHEHDGGYYIGTGCMVIMRDPDSGWINYGAYRVQAHDRALA